MPEIAATVGLTSLAVYVVLVAVQWGLYVRRAGSAERSLFVRWAGYSALFMAALAGWIVAGIAAFLYGTGFGREVWVAATGALWAAYVPALLWVIRIGNRQTAAARAADAGPVG